MPPQTVPERHLAVFRLHTLYLHNHLIREQRAMAGDKQHPGTGQQLEGVSTTQLRPDGEGAQQRVVGQRMGWVQNLHPARNAQLMGGMDKCVLTVIVERLPITRPGIDTRYALHLTCTGVFQYEQEPLGFVGFVCAGKGAGGLINLGGQCVLFFGQGG